ncbi:hypothetical protein ACHWQZ_G003971 [Mnemiopsis leidyi]
MAPNVSVPMNFGLKLLDSPTHNTLELKASQGAVVRASSVILSFNSPVIDHMTTSLHLTSVDMEEFSEEAVRYFVDAAYSGLSPPISKELFRNVNKLANIYEVSWLVSKCVEHFIEFADSIKQISYEDFVYLFDEANFVLNWLNSRDLIKIAHTTIRSLDGQKSFIGKYLENLTAMSSQQLDLIIELAGNSVDFIVGPLTEQLTATLENGEAIVPVNCKYLLENCELHLCQINCTPIFVKLFDSLEKICEESLNDTKWMFNLYRKATEKRERFSEGLTTINSDSVDSVVSEDYLELQPRICDSLTDPVIPNLFHTLDFSLKFEQVVDWLGESELVTSLLMFFEGIWAWMFVNKNVKVKCTSHVLENIQRIQKKRKWNFIYSRWLNFIKSTNGSSERFFTVIRNDLEKKILSSSWEGNKWGVIMDNQQASHSIWSIFEKETKLVFLYRHPSVKECLEPGECGFILRTIPANDGANVVLCTDSSDYFQGLHFHEETKAKDMHLSITTERNGCKIPLSWLGKPELKNGQVRWNMLSSLRESRLECWFLVIFDLEK